MALSGSTTWDVQSTSQNIKIKLDWTATQNIANNYSDVTVKVTVVRGTYGYNTNSTADAQTLWIDGGKYTGTSSIGGGNNSSKQIMSQSKRVYHNADGSKSFKVQFSKTFALSYAGTWIGTQNFPEVTYTLNTIPRATTPTLSNSNPIMGTEIRINLPRASESFIHNIYHDFLDGKWTLLGQGHSTYKDWVVPLDTYAKRIPNSSNAGGRIKVDTYNGSTFIGSKIINFTAHLPGDVKPSKPIVSVSEAFPLIANLGAGYVKGHSALNVSMTATGAYGSTLVRTSITANFVTYNSSSITTGPLVASGNNTIYCEVADSRGRINSTVVNINVLDYKPPTIRWVSVYRSNIDGTFNDNGTNATLVFNAEVSSLGGKNIKAFYVKYKPHGGPTWTTIDLTGTNYLEDRSFTFGGFSVDQAYDFELHAADYFQGVIHKPPVLPTGFSLINYHQNGKALSFGEVSDGTGFGVNMVAKFKKPVQLLGGIEGLTLHNGDGSLAYFLSLDSTVYFVRPATFPYQPSDWGLIFITKMGTEWSMLFHPQPAGNLYRKSGNHQQMSGWDRIAFG